MAAKITEHDLRQFYGSENYYRHWTRAIVYTDGIHYLVENGAAWLVDAVASYQPQLKKVDFQLWELRRTGTQATLTCREDTGKKPLVTQEIEFTDFPLDEIKIYVELGSLDGKTEARICMLTSER